MLPLGRMLNRNAQGVSLKSTASYASPPLRRLRPYQSEVCLLTSNEFLGRVFEMEDFKSPTPESLAHLQAIIDEAFGRDRAPIKV
jgi:hypothetical protein